MQQYVFVLFCEDEDEVVSFCGAFSTNEKAEKSRAAAALSFPDNDYFTMAVELDNCEVPGA